MRDRIRRLTDELSEVRFVASDELLAHSHPKLSMAELIDVLVTNYREQQHPEERARRARERRERRLGKKKGKSESSYLSEEVESPTATPDYYPHLDGASKNRFSSDRTQLASRFGSSPKSEGSNERNCFIHPL